MKPLPPGQWDASLRHVVDDMKGRPLNVHRLMANNPELLNAWWSYRNHGVQGGTLTQRDGELVILRVAVQMQCWYEWASHVDRGLASGLTMAEIESVREGPGDSNWHERDALLLKCVDELVNEHGIRAATQEKLAAHFTEDQLMDIIAIKGMYVTLACMINTWGLELDQAIEERLPAGVSQHEFEHRLNSGS